ncbi:hypothetical protein L486_05144 [Kwoniella mangroviensis CBS 10435]|uniref:DUF6699 domain-containing protein n=1 Tax=Kwoniella mangroviensis CBS 10435 TaxID=1331196 RepID=A0A1B9IQ95_9TREE|nr:hypothetical protein L486_05144 [Kwoniella mangroviensis CBS 10435]
MARKAKTKNQQIRKPNYKTLQDLPYEVIERIIFNLSNPYDHLTFLKTCSTVYRSYSPRIYRMLCINQGFSRSEKDNKLISWCGLFHLVLGHADTCKEVYCNGVISVDRMIGHPKDGFPGLRAPRKLHIHLKDLTKSDLKSILDTPSLSMPINSQILDTIYRGLEDTTYLITFWSTEIRKLNGSLGSHPALGWAFACQPPTTTITLKMYMTNDRTAATIQVENEMGITVFDVIRGIHRCLNNNLPRTIRERYPKHLQKRLTWFDHIKLAERPQKSRVIFPIEKVDLIRSTDGGELILKISLRRIDY